MKTFNSRYLQRQAPWNTVVDTGTEEDDTTNEPSQFNTTWSRTNDEETMQVVVQGGDGNDLTESEDNEPMLTAVITHTRQHRKMDNLQPISTTIVASTSNERLQMWLGKLESVQSNPTARLETTLEHKPKNQPLKHSLITEFNKRPHHNETSLGTNRKVTKKTLGACSSGNTTSDSLVLGGTGTGVGTGTGSSKQPSNERKNSTEKNATSGSDQAEVWI